MVEQTYTCIYCLQTKPPALFNSEHVIPKAFGLFGTETFTLINKVCIGCNQELGDAIDNVLSRETLEGIHRFQHGAKSPKELKKFEYKKHARNQTRVATSELLKGHELELVANENGTGLDYKLKDNYDVAFKTEDGSYEFYYMNQLPDGEILKQKYPNCLEGIKIINADKEYDIVQALSRIFNTKYELNEETHEGDSQVKAIYTKEAFRAIAKIAFNYLAYFNDSSLMIQEYFDPIRNFIAKGMGEWSQFIQIENEPIAPDNDGKAADVHLVTVYANERAIFASVSLHNMQHYKICLAQYYQGKPFKVGYGHCFDPYGHKIHKLGKSSLVLAKLPPLSIQIVKPFIWLPG